MKKREAVRTILRMGRCNSGTTAPDYVLCDDCPFRGSCETPNYSVYFAQAWWSKHKGKDFTKHYKVGDWLFINDTYYLLTEVYTDSGVGICYSPDTKKALFDSFDNDADIFYPIYPKKFSIEYLPEEFEGEGFYQFICEESAQKGKRTIVFGKKDDHSLSGYCIYSEVDPLPEEDRIGSFSDNYNKDAYKPVKLTIKL